MTTTESRLGLGKLKWDIWGDGFRILVFDGFTGDCGVGDCELVMIVFLLVVVVFICGVLTTGDKITAKGFHPNHTTVRTLFDEVTDIGYGLCLRIVESFLVF
jgi:hypothetical protein